MYETLMFIHLSTIIPCVFIGTAMVLLEKGTLLHKRAGRIYMVLMLFTATITLFMPAKVGATFLGHFGWIHLLSVLALWTVPSAYLSIKRGNVESHKRKMLALYFGAILVAGGFTLMPGRYLHGVFFG